MPQNAFSGMCVRTPNKCAGGLGPFYFISTKPSPNKTISGVTRNAAGAPLGGCIVNLFRNSDNLMVDEVVSNGGGSYLFGNCSPTETYYCVAYLAGSPDVAGTTINTLVGV